MPLPELSGDYNGLRLGTQEVTRWGMLAGDMPVVAELLCRVLVEGERPEAVRPDVVDFRRRFQEVGFVSG